MSRRDIDLGRLCAYTQHAARFHGAYYGRPAQVTELIRRAGKWKPEDAAEIERQLAKPAVRLLLQNKYEVGIWSATGGAWCLVSYALPASSREAAERITHRPLDPQQQCAFCMLGEKAIGMLRPDLDLRGNNPTPGLLFHRQCLPSWRNLRALAAKDTNHV